MGLAASQARYLALTARKSDLEYQSQTINTRRIQLAYRTAEIAEAYSAGMNNKRIQISSKNKDGETIWNAITFKNVNEAGFVVIPIGGQTWPQTGQASPYTDDSTVSTNYVNPNAEATITQDDYNGLSDSEKNLFEEVKDTSDNITGYKLKSNITDTMLTGLSDNVKRLFIKNGDTYELAKGLEEGSIDGVYAKLYKDGTTRTVYTPKLNPQYDADKKNLDIETLLRSHQGQLVSKEFYSFLRQHGYNPLSQNGSISPEQFAALQEEFENADVSITGGAQTVLDWRADETEQFGEKSYTSDDAAVLAKYERDTAEVQRQDKILELQVKNIETQHKAIETELEEVKKVIQQNIEKTFKIFS